MIAYRRGVTIPVTVPLKMKVSPFSSKVSPKVQTIGSPFRPFIFPCLLLDSLKSTLPSTSVAWNVNAIGLQ